jgi:large subunit ribosomal protein L7/L12
MAVSRADVLTYLEKSNMIEISELITEIEEKFGVTAAAPVAAVAAVAAGIQRLRQKPSLM